MRLWHLSLILALSACMPPPERVETSRSHGADKSEDQVADTPRPSDGAENPGDPPSGDDTPAVDPDPESDDEGREDPMDPIQPSEPLPKLPGGLYRIQDAQSLKCLEIPSLDNRTPMTLWNCNGSAAQVFEVKVSDSASDEFTIRSSSHGKALELSEGSKAEGALLWQSDVKAAAQQTFVIKAKSAERYAVQIKHSGFYLKASGPRNNAQVRQQKLGSAEGWIFSKVDRVPSQANGRRYHIVNDCDHDVWVAGQANPGFSHPDSNWKLAPGEFRNVDTPSRWQGRFWGRYNCSMQGGKLVCESGGCPKGENCGGDHGEPPASLAEVLTEGFEGMDFYDISLVDGSNLPMNLRPIPGTFRYKSGDAKFCKALQCTKDLNTDCPRELQKKNAAGTVIGCMSACEAFRTDEYCCLGKFATVNCRPSKYAEYFDKSCPDAYSFAEDIKTFACRDADYEVSFCPK